MDALVTNTLLITMDPETPGSTGTLGIVDDGAVGWSDGEIVAVGPAADLEVDASDADRVIDAGGCVTLPGFVNAHAHMRHTIVRGAAQDVPEIEWMNRALGPIAAHANAEDEVVGCRLGALEALASGTTTVCEYARGTADLVERVYEPLGTRVVATETINEVPSDRANLGPRETYPFDRDQGEADLQRAERLFDTYRDHDRVEVAYGPQALDMVSLDLLSETVERARERDRTVHMHVSQGERERMQIEERYGVDASTPSVLEAEGLLGDHLLAAHLHGATPEERARLAASGVRMVGCPSSITAIDGIVPPIAEYLEHGGVVGIGTDQAPGPGGHHVVRELRTAAMLAKADAADPTALDATDALTLGTMGGARALGLADRIGSLTVGKRADVVVCDLRTLGVAPTVAEPFHTAIPNLVYGASGAEVRDVFVEGDRLVENGEIVAGGVDVDAVVAEAEGRAERIFADAEADWRDAGSSLVGDADAGRL